MFTFNRTNSCTTTDTSDDVDNIDSELSYKSPWSTKKLSTGPNRDAYKGPNEDLLLYVKTI